MNEEIFVKFVEPQYIEKEIVAVGFDNTYRAHAVEKNRYKTIKIKNLKPQEATILKQAALALGFDAAVNRGVLDCTVESSDAIISGSFVQFKRLSQSIMRQPFRLKQLSKLIIDAFSSQLKPFVFKNKTFDWTSPYLMGILNITPDSFSDGGKFFELENAIQQFKNLVDSGADIIDIGAESTRPNHKILPYDEEIRRLRPILKEIKNLDCKVTLSVDTRNVKTAQMAVDMGVEIINDVGFDGFNYKMIDFVNANNVAYIVMHNNQVQGSVSDVVYGELFEVLQKINAPVIADIGIGFGKNIEQNYELISRAGEFRSLGVPILVGHSRKSFLSKKFNFTPEQQDEASVVISSKLADLGVNVLRVHDVRKNRLMLDVLGELKV